MENKLITAARIADALTAKGIVYEEKKMFGGICFLVNDKILAGANRDNKLLTRIDPEEETELLTREGTSMMVHGNRPMSGFMYVEEAAYESDADLDFWLEKCLAYNPKAKSSKKKK
ncbi:MAG: RNA methyltransferase [Bacteroidetes bacterium]|nr:RNA methyltransferase [Bacteroidota bacterium]